MYTELADYGLTWAVLLAGTGVAVIAALLLVLATKNPKVGALISRTLLSPSRLSSRLMIGFSLIGIVPVLTLAAFLTVDTARALAEEQVARLENQAANIANSVTPLFEQKVSGFDALAGHLSAWPTPTETELRGMLLGHHQVNPEFVSMWVARPDGQVIVATSASNGKVKPWRGPAAGVALMESFQTAVEQEALYVAPVSKGAAPAFNPMIVISAPVLNGADVPNGFLQAQLNLRELVGGIVDVSSSAGTHAVIVNAANQVLLASSGLMLRPFESLAGHPLGAAAGNGGGFTFSGAIEVTGTSGDYVAVERSLANGWRAFAIASQAGIVGLVMMHFAFALVGIPVVLLLARSLAGIYGGAVAEPLKQLDESLDIFDIERPDGVVPPAPQDAAKEVREVYDGVRELMSKSRDAYGNMMRAVQEGAELREKLRNVVGSSESEVGAGVQDAPMPDVPGFDVATLDPEVAYTGRLDPETGLAGQELFEDFLSQAWMLGVTDGRPVSLLLFGVTNGDEAALKSVAELLSESTGRVLDLVARTETDEFSMLLPDTDLNGARAVAERTLKHVRSEFPTEANPQALAINVAVISIVPTADRDPRSFTVLARRVLKAARKRGDGKVGYIGSEGKVGWA